MTVQSHSLERLETRTCFAATTPVPPPPPPPITALADINGDGKVDLVTLYVEPPVATTSTATTPAKPTWELKLQLGKGDGTFSAPKEFDVPTQAPVALAVGDLDGDGKADLAILNRDPAPTTGTTTTTAPPAVHESIFVLKTDGKGALLPPPTTTAAPKPIPLPDGFDGSSIAISDLNKDSLQDLVAIGNFLAKPAAGSTTVPKPVVNVATLLNTVAAKGTFQKPVLTATDADPGFYQLSRAGDLDKNGSPDLVAYQVAPPPPPPGQIAPAPVPSSQPPKNLALIFSNGDGALKAKSQANPLLPPPSAGTGSTDQQSPSVRTLGVSDIDGDGIADLVGANATSILVSKFDPKTLAFQAAKPAASTNIPANLATSQILFGDVNGDGKFDLLAASDKGVTLGLNTSKSGAPAFVWTPVAVPPKAS